MSSNLGRRVKWESRKDGGWKTGRVITLFDCNECYFRPETRNGSIEYLLIKEDYCGTLSWVDSRLLQNWPDVEYCSRCTKEKDKCECKKATKQEEEHVTKQLAKQYIDFLKKDCSLFEKVTTEEQLRSVLGGTPPVFSRKQFIEVKTYEEFVEAYLNGVEVDLTSEWGKRLVKDIKTKVGYGQIPDYSIPNDQKGEPKELIEDK